MRGVANLGLPLSLLVAFSACASQPGAGPAQTAEKITRAVYADDLVATAGDFEDALKGTVTRSDVGFLSDRMHALGVFNSLAPLSSAPDSGRYTYTANFEKGRMVVQLRIDPDGKVGAYRVVPGATPESVHASL